MATIRTISLRLKSVRNIQKITKSMKMVSAAKYARAERELKAARPIGEVTAQFYVNNDVGSELDEEKEQKRKRLYVAVTSDRGLCGAVHTSVGRRVRQAMEKYDIPKIICIGDKARGLLQRQFKEHFLFVCNEVGRVPPTFLDACRIANEILQNEYEFDLGKIVYNRFRSVVSYTTNEIPIFRLQTVMESRKVQNYEDADDETLTSFNEFSLAGLLFYALKESACSEQSARMTAMDNASKNAAEMIGHLTLTFNRTRQAVITRELIEIVSGASAL